MNFLINQYEIFFVLFFIFSPVHFLTKQLAATRGILYGHRYGRF